MTKRKTPIMGWASWNCFRTNISEDTIKEQAEALVRTGLADCGYIYVNTDDGFFGGRDADGKIKTHPERFPNGMQGIVEYIHGLGLKAGIYSDAGDNTCGHYYDNEGESGRGVGLYGHEEEDLYMYLKDWGYDFIKVDWCGGLRMGLDEETQYSKIGNIIDRIRNEEQRELVYNICRWQFPGEWAADVADSWRTGADIAPNFSSILHQLDMVKPLREYCGPGHVNDLDMLQIGNGMSLTEDETHFVMWCIMSTPLMIGCDLTKLDSDRIAMLSNRELIAINQDKACLQGYVVKESKEEGSEWEIWIKDLGEKDSSEKAVVFLNRGMQSIRMNAQLEEIGLSADSYDQVKIRDLLKHRDITFTGTLDFEIEGHSCVVLRISAQRAVPVKDLVQSLKQMEFERVKLEELKNLTNTDYRLIDVRSEEEYERKHLEGAMNIPYTAVHDTAVNLFDKDDELIVYCSTGKRSSQAAKSLAYLGYTKVRILTPDFYDLAVKLL